MRRHERPLTHEWIWRALDTLAQRRGLTPSALARLAGLDPTTFNRSKRFTPEGRPRWPSTESIAKVLEATGTTLDEFATIELASSVGISFDESEEGEISGVPVVGVVRDAVVTGWEPTAEPGHQSVASPAGRRRFALAVADSSLEPVYSVGNTLVVSEAAEPRPGDRVLVKPSGMPVMPRLLIARSRLKTELAALGDAGQKLALRNRDIDWIARIILVRQ